MKTNTRRSYLKKSTLAVGCTVLPSYLTAARKKGDRLPPSERINLGCVGVGGRARSVIPSLCSSGAEPVAFCDVDFQLAKGIDQNLTKYPDVPRFNDFRIMFDKMAKDMDAVSVVVPDHSHFCAAIAAMALGKHVYVEKPLTHTFEEAEILMRAEKKFGVATQMGNQGHTGSGIDLFAKMVDLGLCDKVTKMAAWKTPSLWFMKQDQRPALPLSVDPIPASLSSWDQWCGPRRKLPFNALYHPFNWRGFYEYGMGMLGDWGAHIIDYAHDKLDMGLPTTIKALRMDDHNQTYFPLASQIAMHFPARGENRPAIDMVWRDGPDCHPEVPKQLWEKSKDGNPAPPKLDKGAGTLLWSDDGEFAIARGHHGGAPRIIPRDQHIKYYEQLKTEKKKGAKVGHSGSFIAACKGDGATNSRFSISGKLAQVLVLGSICQYLNEDLTFDPKKKQFVGSSKANALLNPPARKGWEEFYRLA